MNNRCPFAVWRPLGRQTEPLIGVPTVLIAHTMVGYLPGTEAMFDRGGYEGTESHFGVGMDGRIEQWQTLDRQADAQWDGNAYATSIETEDRGDPSRPWLEAQLDALVRLTAWWCRTTGNPAKLVDHPTGHGIGYHRQFEVWNRSHHTCPGEVRERQLIHTVIPRVAAALAGHATHEPHQARDHKEEDVILDRLPTLARGAGSKRPNEDVRTIQGALRARHSYDSKIDGEFGPKTERAVRREQGQHHILVDGIVGPHTWAVLLTRRDL